MNSSLEVIVRHRLIACCLTVLMGFAFTEHLSAAPRWTKKGKKKKVEHKADFHDHSVGVGLQIAAGTFSGISVIAPLTKTSFVQGNLGVSFLNGSFSATADYAMEFPDLIGGDSGIIPYAGGGVVILLGQEYASLISDIDGTFHMGGRLPLGVYMMLDEFPVNFFGEVTPGLLMLSSVTPILSITLGFRWMF